MSQDAPGDRPLGLSDGVGLVAELGCIGAVLVGVVRVGLGQPDGDLGGHRLRGTDVVEDVLVGSVTAVNSE